jgi:hypothetical protein
VIDPIALVNATTACIDALGILAAPILFTRHRKDAERRRATFDLAPRFDAFLRIVPNNAADEKLARLAKDIAEVRAMLACLESPHDVDRAIVDAAREALARFGFSEPRGGWDRYAGA